MAFKSSDLPASHFALSSSHKSHRTKSQSWITCANSNGQLGKQPQHPSQSNKSQKELNGDNEFVSKSDKTGDSSRSTLPRNCYSTSIQRQPGTSIRTSNKRDKSRNTQGTTIVHRRYRPSSDNSLALRGDSVNRGLQSQSSSRKTTIRVGHPGYSSQRGRHPSAQLSRVVDDTRRKAETQFYETIANGGLVRRKSMIRTVSKEDYLLARGANPRTGLVTPGYHSFSESFDEAEVLKARGIVAPGKWRQKGNQWIILDVEQRTPSPISHSGRVNANGHSLRTPQKLTSTSHVAPPGCVEAEQVPAYSQTTPQSNLRPVVRTPDGIPGGYPHTPQEVRTHPSTGADIRPKPLIRRKPLREHDHLISQESWISPTAYKGLRPDAAEQQPFEDDLRSASAPILHKFPYFSPNEVGKDLPALPKIAPPYAKEDIDASNNNDPFLGQQQYAQPRTDRNLVNSSTSGQRLNKELPCLPMNSGLSPLLPCHPFIAPMDKLGNPENQTGYQSNPQQQVTGSRAKNPAYSYTRTPEQMYTVDHNTRNLSPNESRLMPVPTYDNPPKLHPAPPGGPTAAHVDGPRQTHPSLSVNNRNANDSTNAHITSMTTNIPTFTNTSTSHHSQKQLQPLYNVPVPKNLPQKPSTRIAIAPNLVNPLRTKLNMSTNMNSGEMVSIPLPRVRPRGLTRPVVARMEESQRVPKVVPPRHRMNTAGTAPQQLWSMTGMLARSEEDEADQELMPPPLKVRPPILHQAAARIRGKPDSLQEQLSGLHRKCSRCHNGFVGVQQRNTDGVIHTSGSQMPIVNDSSKVTINPSQQNTNTMTIKPVVNASPISDTTIEPFPASLSDISEIDERDHTICCPECCKEQDCHEGCLGHPSPSSNPVKNIRLHEKVAKKSIDTVRDLPIETNDAQSMTSEKARYGRLAFVRAAFRNSFKLWGNMDKVEHGLNSVPLRTTRAINSDSPPIELAAQPLSPTSFWGADAAGGTAGAVEAAKTAMGMKQKNDAGKQDSENFKARVSSRPKTAPGIAIERDSIASPNANEGRRITSVSSIPVLRIPSLPTTIRSNPRSRNVSGASVATIEIQVPGFGSLSFGSVWEIFLVPFAVSRMWMRNHPQVMAVAGDATEKGLDMGRLMTATGSKLWSVVFVYSKTGKLRLKNHQGTPGGSGRVYVEDSQVRAWSVRDDWTDDEVVILAREEGVGIWDTLVMTNVRRVYQ